VEGGLAVRWIPRVRTGADRWDLEPIEVDPSRFRVRVLDDAVERRVIAVDGTTCLYSTQAIVEDFPAGPGPTASIAVAQYGPDWGWGEEAVVPLAA
jgi:hypothetical protein